MKLYLTDNAPYLITATILRVKTIQPNHRFSNAMTKVVTGIHTYEI